MRVRRVLASEHRQRRVAIAGSHVAQNLIVRSVFADDQEHVLNQRRIADLGRDGNWLSILGATGCRLDILRQIPVVILENLFAVINSNGPGTRQGNDADGAIVLVGIVASDTVVGLEGITRADAFVVGYDEDFSAASSSTTELGA